MATQPFLPAKLEDAVRKLVQRQPLTGAEREAVLEALDATPEAEEGGVILSPEDEAELKERITETDEAVRTGRAMTWEQFLAGRAQRRAG
jgi:hypothetical protein